LRKSLRDNGFTAYFFNLSEISFSKSKSPRQTAQVEHPAPGGDLEIEDMKIGHPEMDPASGLNDKYVAFEGLPAEPSIQHRVGQLTEQQTKIPHMDVAQLVRRALHRKAGDFLAATALAPGNTADAANFEGTCVALSSRSQISTR
jgi:hypothetical protein